MSGAGVTPGRKALFLDRDGTLIIDKHYLADPAGVELLPGVAEGLRRARELGYLLFLFSNQAGVGRGYFKVEAAHAVNARMLELLDLGADLFADICLATEAPDQPIVYRKPSPRFIHEMVDEYGLDRSRCVMVGDRETDMEAGINAGIAIAGLCNGKLDRTGWGKFTLPGLRLYDDFTAFSATLG